MGQLALLPVPSHTGIGLPTVLRETQVRRFAGPVDGPSSPCLVPGRPEVGPERGRNAARFDDRRTAVAHGQAPRAGSRDPQHAGGDEDPELAD